MVERYSEIEAIFVDISSVVVLLNEHPLKEIGIEKDWALLIWMRLRNWGNSEDCIVSKSWTEWVNKREIMMIETWSMARNVYILIVTKFDGFICLQAQRSDIDIKDVERIPT